MIGLKLKLEFSPKPVQDATDRAADRVLSRFGAFVWKAMRSSIKPAPKTKLIVVPGRARRKRVAMTAEERIAPPGRPPFAHKGNTLKRFIRFAVDKARRSVVIGAERLPGKIGDAPHALEAGGRSQAIRGLKRVLRETRVRPHPFAQPALAQELPNLAGMWKDQIK